jgi:hypothetical protein
VADSLPRVSIDDRHVISPACSTDPLGPPVADTTALVAHRDVVAAVEGTLRKRGRTNRQLEDDVLEVQVRAIKAARKGSMPKDVGEWKAFTTTIACRFVIDAQARERTRFKHETELSEETEAYASPILPWEGRDLVDTKRFLGVLKELVDSGQMPEMGGTRSSTASSGSAARSPGGSPSSGYTSSSSWTKTNRKTGEKLSDKSTETMTRNRVDPDSIDRGTQRPDEPPATATFAPQNVAVIQATSSKRATTSAVARVNDAFARATATKCSEKVALFEATAALVADFAASAVTNVAFVDRNVAPTEAIAMFSVPIAAFVTTIAALETHFATFLEAPSRK